MSEIVAAIDVLEARLQKLLDKIGRLEQASARLQQDLRKADETIRKQASQMEELANRYESLKIANSLLGSEENKRDTKLKINALIREIDYCIAQMAD